jgi:hypothetical protein
MLDPHNPTIGSPRPACRATPDELAAVLRDEAMLREAGLDVPPRHASVPPAADPWAEDGDQLRAAKGISLGVVLSAAFLGAVVLVLLLCAWLL